MSVCHVLGVRFYNKYKAYFKCFLQHQWLASCRGITVFTMPLQVTRF